MTDDTSTPVFVQDSFALKGLQLFFKSCHSTTFLIRDQLWLGRVILKIAHLLQTIIRQKPNHIQP